MVLSVHCVILFFSSSIFFLIFVLLRNSKLTISLLLACGSISTESIGKGSSVTLYRTLIMFLTLRSFVVNCPTIYFVCIEWWMSFNTTLDTWRVLFSLLSETDQFYTDIRSCGLFWQSCYSPWTISGSLRWRCIFSLFSPFIVLDRTWNFLNVWTTFDFSVTFWCEFRFICLATYHGRLFSVPVDSLISPSLLSEMICLTFVRCKISFLYFLLVKCAALMGMQRIETSWDDVFHHHTIFSHSLRLIRWYITWVG